MKESDIVANEYEFDVAVSFQGADERLANEIADSLSEQFSTFIYSKRQDMLAGRDGEIAFGDVFRHKARTVIVLCRQEWGETPFTRIECDAIRNRAFDHGYDFSLFVPTTSPPFVPPWLPKTRLYYGLERFGVSGLSGVVEQLVQANGGFPRIEGIAQRAARFQRSQDFQKERDHFNRSEKGVEAFKAAIQDTIVPQLETGFAQLQFNVPALTRIKPQTIRNHFVVSNRSPVLVVSWFHHFSNTLEGAEFKVELFDKFPNLPGLFGFEDAKSVKKINYVFDWLSPGEAGFIRRSNSIKQIRPDAMADEIMRHYLDEAERFADRGQ